MKTKAKISSRWLRFRALLIDIFLIYIPILYLFYFLLGSKEAFFKQPFYHNFMYFFIWLDSSYFFNKKRHKAQVLKHMIYILLI